MKMNIYFLHSLDISVVMYASDTLHSRVGDHLNKCNKITVLAGSNSETPTSLLFLYFFSTSNCLNQYF